MASIDLNYIKENAEEIEQRAQEYETEYTKPETNRHREVEKLSADWWADFIIGMYLRSFI